MAKKIKFIIMVLGIILMTQLFSSCAVSVGATGGKGGFLKFNYWDQYKPPVWDEYSREYYHFEGNWTLQRTSANTWRVWLRNQGRLQPFGEQENWDFNIYQALEKANYMKGQNLKVTYFHPVYHDLRVCYDVIVNGDRFIISGTGRIYRDRPDAVLDAPSKKFFLPEGKWVSNQY